MKNMKRILEVKIVRKTDTDPDTSYYGEYSTTAESPYTIDRATGEFQGDIETAKDWLQRIEARLDDAYNAALDAVTNAEETLADASDDTSVLQNTRESAALRESVARANQDVEDLDAARETISDTSVELDDVSWNSREYRYFNPSDNYKGEPDEDVRKYVRQDYQRMEDYNRGYWCYVGLYATAEVEINGVTQTIRSGGLWGTESDSDDSYFAEIAKDELETLRGQLEALGFSKRAISTAFKTVKEESN